MKHLFYLLLLSFPTLAQTVPGHIGGQVIDEATKLPLPFATVAAYQHVSEKDSLVGGAQTDDKGHFSVDKLPAGPLTLRASFVGYVTVNKVVSEADRTNDVTLSVQPDAKQLKEVEVKAEKGTVSLSMEKRTFDVGKNLTTIGGTAENVLKNVPSISVDESGNATLRNLATTIYINGKPTQLTLAQIPANQIETVEVITNPPARYDASTSGGIVNLVLKKNRAPGYSGIATLGVGNNSRYDASANVEWRRGPWSLTGLYAFNATQNPVTGSVRRINRDAAGTALNYFEQNTLTNLDNRFHNGRLAAEYTPNAQNVFSVAATLASGAFNTVSNQPYFTYSANRTLTGYGNRQTVPQNDFSNLGLEFDYKHNFARKGRELALLTSFTRNQFSNAADWLTTSLLTDGGTLPGVSQPGYPERDRIDGKTTGSQYLAQLDYVHPLSDSSKLEMGLRSFTYARDQRYFFNQLDNTTQAYNLLTNYSQNAQITETVNAVYILYTSKLRHNFSLQAGLRLEQSSLNGLSRFDGSSFGYYFPGKNGENLIRAFFPSFSLTKMLSPTREIGLSLSRKVGRPNFRHVFVGIQANDRQNITIGNPSVQPEFINTAELNYSTSWGQMSWLATAYYILEDHTIKPITYTSPTDPTVLITTFQNITAEVQYGVEQTLKVSLGRNLSGFVNVNARNFSVQSTTLQNSSWTYNGKLNLTYKFPANISAQATINRDARVAALQGYREAVNGADLAVRKGFWQNRASVALIVNDVFNSRRFISIYDQPLAYQTTTGRREVRFYKLVLQIPLGKPQDGRKRNDRKLDRPDVDFSN
ncbi:outer membrane beta-barrel family protein [Fibrella aquatilis]|uniref:TonB-dependent receptor n=1 Tax=Fibrella aquatilis TaxID=2817059 RepID=A0A939G4W3_9BACT|nr:outer membrane beta-barrel family protein [Fibrella aquatilis]MBO0930066.1 TonB-dependent receptor [Fibrella aquatilis]